MSPSSAESAHRWTHEAHRRRQIRKGLELTPLERLRWLEATMEELRPLVGRAREASGGGRSATPREGSRSG